MTTNVPCLSSLVMVAMVTVSPCSAKVIDLSHKHGPDTFMSGSSAPYNRTVFFKKRWNPAVFLEMANIFIGEHGGTHIDAPSHFIKDATSIDELPLENFILDGVMIDCSADVDGNADYVMPVQKLHDWEKEHGKIPMGAGIVVNFDWSSRFGNTEEYINCKDITAFEQMRYPTISGEAGKWLVESRQAKLLATDTMSPDMPDFPVHYLFLGQKATIVENVRDPGRLPARGFRLHAAPVAYLRASGTQIRLYAITHNVDAHANKAAARLGVEFAGLVIMLAFTLFVAT